MGSVPGGAGDDGAVLCQLGEQAEGQGHLSEARSTYERALTAFRDAGNHQGELGALRALGMLEQGQKRTEIAGQYYEQALAVARALDDRRAQAILLGVLSNVRVELARYDDAIRYLEQSLAIGEALGDAKIVGAARNNLNALRRSRRSWLWRLLRLG